MELKNGTGPLFAPGTVSDRELLRLSPEECIYAMFDATDRKAHRLLLQGTFCAEEDDDLVLSCELWWWPEEIKDAVRDFKRIDKLLRRFARRHRREKDFREEDVLGGLFPDLRENCAAFAASLEPTENASGAGENAARDKATAPGATSGATAATAPEEPAAGAPAPADEEAPLPPFSSALREGGHYTIAYDVFYRAYRLYRLYAMRAPRYLSRNEARLLAQALALYWNANKVDFLRTGD